MGETTIDDAKSAIRDRIRRKRDARSETDVSSDAEGLLDQLSMLVVARGARTVSCYYPTVTEPNTLPFLNWAIDEGVRVLLPISRVDGLLDWVEYGGGEVAPGLFGIPEPSGEPLSPIAVGDVDLMIVPACAVDERGNRLGWGRGYFDKTLGSMDQRPPVFAVVTDDEVLPSIPTDLHDVPVTGAVTPTRIIHFDRDD